MMILTSGLSDRADEGCLNVATNLVKELKKLSSDITVVTYERSSFLEDIHLDLNKFMTNSSLKELCKQHEDVLYIPFPTRKWVMAMRVFVLSRYTKRLRVVLTLKTPINFLGRFLLRVSGAEFIVFSKDAAEFYSNIVGSERVTCLKTGVDTDKFVPISDSKVLEIKKKYGLNEEKKVVLHIGHLNEGRNIRELMKISKDYQVLIVTSTLTKHEQDLKLREELLACENIRLMDEYIPNICEIYQLSDVYFFPVKEEGRCIDVPLSCLEAAACGKPVITTGYGEMKELGKKQGFFFLKDFERETINETLEIALKGTCPRASVMEYDWKNAARYLMIKER